ncbi:hypothetical protein FVF58_30675 [Paraburkholderia panacisoli]|uniref:Uncharacterized protein n=1 Tax=Paraburkholderia panacisoli TaxID=2603818 RepID=A0A5B0GNJ4_9BURK|nr:hypothetical protein FVF58_30675 [Paraburkholderia panacisoli]
MAYVIRRWPFSSARLVCADMSVDFSAYASSEVCTAVIATTPLTDEAWSTCSRAIC